MDRNLLYRGLLIVTIVVVMAISAYPPEEKINLGLDLQGGMHLVLKVKTDDAIRAETDNTIDTLVRELADRDIQATTERTGIDTFDVLGVPSAKDDEIEDDVVEVYLPGWKMARSGDRLQISLTPGEANNLRSMSVNQAQETIRNRVDAFGVGEPIIHDEGAGSDRIVVQLPGVVRSACKISRRRGSAKASSTFW